VADPSLDVSASGTGPIEDFLAMLSVARLHGGPPSLDRLRFAFNGVLDRSHGALLAVADPDAVGLALAEFETSVRLNPPIDLHANEVSIDPSVITERGTREIVSILHALTGMDRIVLLSSDARVHGYRCFIKATGSGPGTGGARRLAFDALKSQRDKFIGALFRSQDGTTQVQSRRC